MEGKWPYRCCFGGCCFWHLFSPAHCILVSFSSSFFSIRFLSVQVVLLYSNTDLATAWKKSFFILPEILDLHMINNLSIRVHAFARCMLISLPEDEILLTKYVNCSTNFRGFPLKVEMAPYLKHLNSVLFVFSQRLMTPATNSRLYCTDSVWEGIFARSARSSAQSVSVIVSAWYCLFFIFLNVKPFFLDLWTFVRGNLGRLQTCIVLMYLLTSL